MTSFLALQRERADDRVIRLDRERVEWTARYIEWHGLGLLPEARLALENLRAARAGLARALRLAALWRWLTKGTCR
jgi:hypothetical protein